MIVIDANVAIEVARNTSRGNSLSKHLCDTDKVIAPTLFVSEAANATWKHAVFGKPAMKDWRQFYTIVVSEVDEFIPDAELLPEALSEAVRLRHSVYDMLYFVLARRTSSPLLTCDHRLAAICEENDIDCIGLVDL